MTFIKNQFHRLCLDEHCILNCGDFDILLDPDKFSLTLIHQIYLKLGKANSVGSMHVKNFFFFPGNLKAMVHCVAVKSVSAFTGV